MSRSDMFDDRRRRLQERLAFLRVAVGAVMGLLAVAFWILQVVQHAKYAEMAQNNHLRTIPLRAPRGVLFDRTGRVLVENRNSFTIAIVREQSANLDAAVDRLAAVTGTDPASLRDIVQRHRKEAAFRPIPVIEHATFAQVAAVTARQLELPEVVVQEVPTRAYPEGLAAHLFGYVSEIQDSQLDRPEFSGLQPGAIVGQAGLEKVYNAQLMGQDGDRKVFVNSVGREVEEIGEDTPVIGDRLQLTIDADLQRALEEAFRANGYSGAAAFLDPNTGEVLAMTSLPSYDPNDFASGMDPATLSRLNSDPLKPFQNRLIQGRYAPGSTFKIVMAIAGLSEGVITPDTRFFCPGSATFYGHTFACSGSHGWMDLRHAIEHSCNVFFYNVGSRLSIDTINKYAAMLGLVGKTGIDLPGEADSLVPSTEWKQKTFGEKWYPGETISVSIGQGAVSVTPISLATMISTVANGGTLITPHLVHAIDDGEGWKPVPPPAPKAVLALGADQLQAVRDGLWLVVNGNGTGGRARIEGEDVSGKTGTAQVVSLQTQRSGRGDMDFRDHGWFVFFAPRDHPQIAGVVLAEHEGHGGTAAAPIAKYVMETFFAKKEGRPLPTLTPPAQKVVAESARPAARPAGPGGGGA